MRDLQEFLPLGTLDQDTDELYLTQGAYRGARNIRHITQNTGSTQSIIPNIGNELAFSLGTVNQQNKIYRVDVTGLDDGSTSHTLDFFKTDGSALASAVFTEGASEAATITNAQTAITAALSAATPPQTVSYTSSASSFTIEIDTVLGYEYSITSPDLTLDITQEAIDLSLTGQLNDIGSYDLLGDLFIWSTPQKNLLKSTTGTVTSIADNGSGLVRITTGVPHGLTTGEQVRISDAPAGPTGANGVWIVDVIDPTTFDLENSTFGSPPATDPAVTVIEQYLSGIGEIGVAQFNNNTSSWTYTRLIRTKEFNFRTQKQVDTYVEQNLVQINLYWTDDFNVPRVLNYVGDFVTNGAITIINPQGQYAYGSIAEETTLILSGTKINFAFTQQLQSGGAILSGNWRYSIRLLSESLVATEWLDLDNPINVYEADSGGDPNKILGNDVSITTSKVNEFAVTGLIPGLFKFIELAGVNYQGNSKVGFIIKRQELGQESSITITHTGTETAVEDLDLGEFNQRTSDIRTAKNIDVVDNRLILSNLTSRQQVDFSAWAQTFKHSILRKSITGRGDAGIGGTQLGDYQDPLAVNDNVGYMMNETYRFGCKVRFKEGGGFSDVFHIDDIIIDVGATNSASTGFPGADPTRRVAGLADYDLSDGLTVGSTFVPYVEFSDIDLDFAIDGTPVKDLIDQIIFMRAEVIPEILTMGVIAVGVTGGDVGTSYLDGSGTNYGEYPWVSGLTTPSNPTYPSGWTAARRFASFHTPDIMYGQTSISHQAGDKILVFGSASPTFVNGIGAGGTYPSNYCFTDGVTGITGLPTSIPTPGSVHEVDIDDALLLTSSASATFSGITYSNLLTGIAGAKAVFRNLVLHTDTGFTFTDVNGSSNADHGLYYAQYFRPLTAPKYGTPGTTTYVSTNEIVDITAATPSVIGTGVIEVFGGDVFTQKTYHKHRISTTSGIDRLGGGLSFFCQNRVNASMKQDTNASTNFPATPAGLSGWLDNLNEPDYQVNFGYNIRNEIEVDAAFDTTALSPSDLPTRIAYSDLKPQNSLVDFYRVFLPLNFKDLDAGFGEIVHHANVNGELLTWQSRKFQRQYFNTRGTLEVSDGTEVLIGDGSVLSRDGQTLTHYGCQHKWSIIKGKSKQGHDVMYWINVELKKAIRFGFDGSISIADINGMQSFLANNLTWVEGKDNPAHEQGIAGVWHDRLARVIWTVRGHIEANVWADGTSYTTGDVILFDPDVQPNSDYTTFEQTTEVYVATQDHTATSSNQPETGVNWEDFWDKKSHDDNQYFNEYTLAYNEFKNGFTTFLTFKPRIYLKWKDGYLSPRPKSNVADIYEHNKGKICSWYEDPNEVTDKVQEEDGFIEAVINKHQQETKYYEALKVQSDVEPFRFDLSTQTHESFLGKDEFERREDLNFSAIKEDIIKAAISSASFVGSTVTITTTSAHGLAAGQSVLVEDIEGITNINGIFTVTGTPTTTTFTYTQTGLSGSYVSGTGQWATNSGNNSLLFGTSMRAKMYFEKLINQKLYGLVTKFRIAPRITQK